MKLLDPCEKPNTLLQSEDPPPFEVLRAGDWQVRAPLLLVCDHASNAIPEALNNLELSADNLTKHIALDIGSAGVSKRLSEAFNAPAVLAGFSRLVVDANRFLSDTSAIPEVSDGVVVPGNQGLSQRDWGVRVEELYVPYHRAVDQQLTAFAETGVRPVLVFVHSFTPQFQGRERPWHIGVVWNADKPSADIMLSELGKYDDWQLGDNQPYNACEPLGYSMATHAEQRGLPHVMLEIRQDLIEHQSGQHEVADRLVPAIQRVLEAQ